MADKNTHRALLLDPHETDQSNSSSVIQLADLTAVADHPEAGGYNNDFSDNAGRTSSFISTANPVVPGRCSSDSTSSVHVHEQVRINERFYNTPGQDGFHTGQAGVCNIPDTNSNHDETLTGQEQFSPIPGTDLFRTETRPMQQGINPIAGINSFHTEPRPVQGEFHSNPAEIHPIAGINSFHTEPRSVQEEFHPNPAEIQPREVPQININRENNAPDNVERNIIVIPLHPSRDPIIRERERSERLRAMSMVPHLFGRPLTLHPGDEVEIIGNRRILRVNLTDVEGKSGATIDLIDRCTLSYCYSDGPDLHCSICISPIQNSEMVRRLCCLHLYHAECIEMWLVKIKRCPECRMLIDHFKKDPNHLMDDDMLNDGVHQCNIDNSDSDDDDNNDVPYDNSSHDGNDVHSFAPQSEENGISRGRGGWAIWRGRGGWAIWMMRYISVCCFDLTYV